MPPSSIQLAGMLVLAASLAAAAEPYAPGPPLLAEQAGATGTIAGYGAGQGGAAAPGSRDTGPAGFDSGMPLSPPRGAGVPLAPPAKTDRSDAAKRPGGLSSVITVTSSLAVALGAFFVLMWVLRRASPPGAGALPNEVVEVLGRAPLSGRQQMHLLRCGRKLLLVSVTPAGAETLTEITDPLEVDRLAGLCQQARPGSATAAFRRVFEQFAPRTAEGQHTEGHDA